MNLDETANKMLIIINIELSKPLIWSMNDRETKNI